MKFVLNTTLHAIYANGTLFVPGTNKAGKVDEKALDPFIKNGDLEIIDSSKASPADKKRAVENANTSSILNDVKKEFKDVDVTKQEEKIKKFEKEVRDFNSKEK